MQHEYRKLNDNINSLVKENTTLIKKLNEFEDNKKFERNTGLINILVKFDSEISTINN